jgi:hypothetical protein
MWKPSTTYTFRSPIDAETDVLVRQAFRDARKRRTDVPLENVPAKGTSVPVEVDRTDAK